MTTSSRGHGQYLLFLWPRRQAHTRGDTRHQHISTVKASKMPAPTSWPPSTPPPIPRQVVRLEYSLGASSLLPHVHIDSSTPHYHQHGFPPNNHNRNIDLGKCSPALFLFLSVSHGPTNAQLIKPLRPFQTTLSFNDHAPIYEK